MASPNSGPVGSNSGGVPQEGDQKFDVFYKDVSTVLSDVCPGRGVAATDVGEGEFMAPEWGA